MDVVPPEDERVVLRPATWRDRRPVFEWLAESDVTPSMHGLPRFPDNPIPTREEFCRDYRPHFFSGSDPPAGRCFIISAGGEEIGVISYGGINRQKSRAELDIWMSCEANCGRGHGARAIMALCLVLREEFGVVEFVMRPSARNARAIRAY